MSIAFDPSAARQAQLSAAVDQATRKAEAGRPDAAANPTSATPGTPMAHMEAGAGGNRNRDLVDAAKQFEGVFIRQLMQVLRKTAPNGGTFGGSGYAGQMYMQMFDDAVADQMAEGSGIGLAPILYQGMGGNPNEFRDAAGGVAARHSVGNPLSLSSLGGAYARAGNDAPAPLRDVADQLLRQADDWSKDGALGEDDLRSGFTSNEAGGLARFNVRDARGYQGYYKCNLFAFEMARRAGFQVPVVGRDRGWGYPVSNDVTRDAGDGALQRDWGKVVTGQSAEALSAAVRSGERGIMLTGSADGGRAGHMAIVERIRNVEYDDEGRVSQVVFDGWEARAQGAQHLTERTWNLQGRSGGNMARNGFSGIEIIELKKAEGGLPREVPLSRSAGPSLLDNSSSSHEGIRPNHRAEDES